MWASNKIRHVQIASSFVFVLFLIGCVYVPSIDNISEETLTTIKVGSTTKEEVRQQLGEPSIMNRKEVFIYQRGRGFGGILFIDAMGGSFYYLPVPRKKYRILIEFNENDVVKRYETERSRYRLDRIGMGETTPDFEETEIQADHGRTILYSEGRRHGLFITATMFSSVAFSPDGKLVAAGDYKNRVWMGNLHTGTVIKFKGKRRLRKDLWIRSIEFSSDGKLLAAGGIDKVARVWDVATGKEIVTFEGHGKIAVTSLAFASDGKTAATGDRKGAVKLWNSTTGHEIMTLEGHKNAITSLAFSPDGNLLATSDNDAIMKLWNPSTGKELTALKFAKRFYPYFYNIIAGLSLTFSPDGKILAIASDTHVELWGIASKATDAELASWNPLQSLEAVFILPYFDYHRKPIGTSVAFSPDGRMLAASAGAAAIWDLSTPSKLWRFVTSGRFTHRVIVKDAITNLKFSSNGETLAIASNDGVYLFDVHTLNKTVTGISY